MPSQRNSMTSGTRVSPGQNPLQVGGFTPKIGLLGGKIPPPPPPLPPPPREHPKRAFRGGVKKGKKTRFLSQNSVPSASKDPKNRCPKPRFLLPGPFGSRGRSVWRRFFCFEFEENCHEMQVLVFVLGVDVIQGGGGGSGRHIPWSF